MISQVIFGLLMTSISQAALTADEQNTIISMHNTVRSSVVPVATNMNKLVWDDSLALSSEKWAATCPIAHSGYPDVGENLSWGWPAMTASEAVEQWVNEKMNYAYSANACAPNSVCGHYTAMIWADTTKVGCAKKSCQNIQGHPLVDAWVCQYSSAGNYEGELPYKTGSLSCSACPQDSTCENNLCMVAGALTPVTTSALASLAGSISAGSLSGSFPLLSNSGASPLAATAGTVPAVSAIGSSSTAPATGVAGPTVAASQQQTTVSTLPETTSTPTQQITGAPSRKPVDQQSVTPNNGTTAPIVNSAAVNGTMPQTSNASTTPTVINGEVPTSIKAVVPIPIFTNAPSQIESDVLVGLPLSATREI